MKRNELREFYKKNTFSRLRTLELIAKKSSLDKNAVFKDLFQLVSDEGILIQAMGKVSKNKGALTIGPPIDKSTAVEASLDVIAELIKSLKEKTFRFKPIRRKYMDRTGKNPITREQELKIIELYKRNEATLANTKELLTRPLGISSFKDKIFKFYSRLLTWNPR